MNNELDSTTTTKSLDYVLGEHNAHRQAIRAYDMGMIDEWVEYIRPKTLEGWEEWKANNPDSPFRSDDF